MKFSWENGILTLAGAWIGNKLDLLIPSLILLTLLMVLDYISGMLASKKEALEHPNNKKYGWSSRKSIMGIYKKAGYILIIVVAISADYIIFKFAEEIGIQFIHNTIFCLLVIVWLIINELLSILENAGRMGAALPESIIKILAELKKDVEDKK